MATAKERLNPPKRTDENLALQVRPVIQMGAPQIKVPEIKIPDIKVSNDLRPIATAIGQLSQIMVQIANMQTQILQALTNQKQPQVTVQSAPAKVQMSTPRPRDYYVTLDKEGDETVGMHIQTVSPQRQ